MVVVGVVVGVGIAVAVAVGVAVVVGVGVGIGVAVGVAVVVGVGVTVGVAVVVNVIMRISVYLALTSLMLGCYPLSQTITFQFEGREQDLPAAQSAAEIWNATCGTNLQVKMSKSLLPGVPIYAASPETLPNKRLAVTHIGSLNTPDYILYAPQEDRAYQIMIFAHEMGHAMGLDHSPDKHDIMYSNPHHGTTVRPEDCVNLP